MTREQLPTGAVGMRLEVDDSRGGSIDDGNLAWEERVFQAGKQWPQAQPEDFERVGRRGWRDKASGVEYRQAPGAPLLAVGEDSTRFISAFFVLDGKLVFLERADIPKGTGVVHGEFYGGQVIDGQIIRETR